MLESTPGAPYRAALKDLLGVEANMRWRYVPALQSRLETISSQSTDAS